MLNKYLLGHDRFLRGSFVVPEPPDPPNPPEPSGPTQFRTYGRDDTTDHPNPERGFHKSDDFSSGANYSYIRSQGYSLLHSTARLDDFRNVDTISAPWLANYNGAFQRAREAGVKVVLRHAYNSSQPGYDAGTARIIGHIEQLHDLMEANKDVIAVLQAGFIGAWGEWHSSTTGADSAENQQLILPVLLDNVPEELQIQFRTAYAIAKATGTTYSLGSWTGSGAPPASLTVPFNSIRISAADRFNGSQIARIGLHNDAFLVNRSDAGSYSFPENGYNWSDPFVNFLKQFTGDNSKYLCFGAEIADDVWNRSNEGNRAAPAAARSEMENFAHIDFLQRDYGFAILNQWISNGFFPEVSRRLGYRLSLSRVTLPTTITSGQPFTVTIQMQNTGFGKVYNKRPIDLTLVRGNSSPVTIRLTSDARRQLPVAGETQEFSYTATAPALSPGTYATYLSLPDPSTTLGSDVRYHIRLMNSGGIWNGNTGRHDLGMTITV